MGEAGRTGQGSNDSSRGCVPQLTSKLACARWRTKVHAKLLLQGETLGDGGVEEVDDAPGTGQGKDAVAVELFAFPQTNVVDFGSVHINERASRKVSFVGVLRIPMYYGECFWPEPYSSFSFSYAPMECPFRHLDLCVAFFPCGGLRCLFCLPDHGCQPRKVQRGLPVAVGHPFGTRAQAFGREAGLNVTSVRVRFTRIFTLVSPRTVGTSCRVSFFFLPPGVWAFLPEGHQSTRPKTLPYCNTKREKLFSSKTPHAPEKTFERIS